MAKDEINQRAVHKDGNATYGGKPVIEPIRDKKRKYTLAELLAECDPTAKIPDLEEWDFGPPVGREIW